MGTQIILYFQVLVILVFCSKDVLSESKVSNDNDVDTSSSTSTLDDITSNNTRCSQTHLSFTKETLLHIWEIKGLLGYISYIKRFDQPFELKTDHVSFKSDNVDGKWIFKVLKVRHNPPFAIPSPSTSPSNADTGDVRIMATYSYEAKLPRKIDFLIHLTLIHGHKEIVLPPQRSTSPIIVQQRYYNTRGYQLNSNFFEYVYTFTWKDVIHPLDSLKTNSYHSKYHIGQQHQATESHNPHRHDEDASEEFFEEFTRSDFSGHFGDVTMKFVISAYFPGDPVSISSSRCNASLLELVSPNLMEKLASSSSSGASGQNFHKDNTQKFQGAPPYLRYTNSMLHDDRFADVILVVGQDEVPAHRIILATSSPAFSEILENTTVFYTSNQTSTAANCQLVHLPRILIEPQDIGLDCIHELLRYVYTGTVDNSKMTEGLANRLIIAADKYGLPELKRLCENIVLQGLRAENAIELYLLGNRVSSSRIIRKALSIMKLNKAKLATQTEDFRQLSLRHPKLMYELFLSD
ncbi:Speckle-type POZ protein B [Orchesella cincta]|uniref:Speckle-type POZ protein B n=1 Tax=Orchesella cincta TaxID=48709 RepID=A0A1D2MU51_ORCCI|nr:Speckle-type POZ protein B [Orchesella cincta]